jgi:Protein kinase domain
MMALGQTKPISELGLAGLLELRYEAEIREDAKKVSLINEIIKVKQAEAEKAEAKAKAEAERIERHEIRELQRLEILKANPEIPNFSGALSAFKAALARAKINAPQKSVLDTLVRRFPMQMTVAAGDTDSAVELYEELKMLPSTTTTARLKEQTQIHLNGPAGAENINILIGSRSDKTPVMVKILIATANHPKLSFGTLTDACRKEAQVCERLGLSSTTLPFVQSEVVDIGDSRGVFRKAIVMPTYVRTVADSARLWPASLIDGSKRMVQALNYMHSLNLVHMDVKGSNILIDQAGDWYLGDFGSARDINDVVITTTPSFYPTDLCGLPALPKYDWFMLLVTILIELMPKKHMWANELCDSGRNVVTFARVKQSLENAMSSGEVSDSLKSTLSDIAMWAELSLPPPPPPPAPSSAPHAFEK